MTTSSKKAQTLRVLARIQEIRSYLHPGQFSFESPRREIDLLEKIQHKLEEQLRTYHCNIADKHLQEA